MITKHGWNRQFMASLFVKEATYNAGVTMNNTNACSMQGFDLTTAWPDVITNDKDAVTNAEFGTTQEITTQKTQLTYKETNARPNTVIGLMALALGSITTTKDGAYNAWKHKIIPVSAGTALPSIQCEELFGGLQYAYPGIKCNKLQLSGKAGGYASVSADLMGSGSRSPSNTAFANAISESWMLLGNCKVWMENGSSISIDSMLTQGTQDISSGTPVNIGPRFESFDFGYDNGLKEQQGFGGGKVLQDLDYGTRKADFKLELLFNDGTEMAHYINQTPVAVEFDLQGAIVTAGSSMYYGAHLVLPRLMMKKAPLPIGGVGDIVKAQFEFDIYNDGTNPAVIFEGYNAKSAYMA